MTYQEVKRKMPKCLAGQFNPLTHATISGLRQFTRHVLDRYYEGLPSVITTNRQLNAARDFLHLCERQETAQ